MTEYKVQFEVFEGPMDLLLYLVRKQEVDIYQVNLTELATAFIRHIEAMRELDVEVAGEFLVMAATLMYIKSKELLPKDKQLVVEEEDEEDPRWELIRQLVEYKKFKDAAAQLHAKEALQESIFPRNPPKPDLKWLDPAPLLPEVSIFDLVEAVQSILKRVQEKESQTRHITADRWTVSEKILDLRERLTRFSTLRFSELFAEVRTRQEVVVTFLAMLELIRQRILSAQQNETFAEIELVAAPAENNEDDEDPAPDSEMTTPYET